MILRQQVQIEPTQPKLREPLNKLNIAESILILKFTGAAMAKWIKRLLAELAAGV